MQRKIFENWGKNFRTNRKNDSFPCKKKSLSEAGLIFWDPKYQIRNFNPNFRITKGPSTHFRNVANLLASTTVKWIRD